MKKIKDLVVFFRDNDGNLIKFYQNLFLTIKKNSKYNFFTEIYIQNTIKKIKDDSFLKNYKTKPLFGVPFFLKDNFNVKGKKTLAGSKILENFIPNFDSTVSQILIDNGAILLGKTVMDELSMGASGLEAKEGYVVNNLVPKRIVGGSSSGSAVAINLKVASFALGTDTGDSIRRPASFLGIIGFKPTFGLISRFGLLSFSPSFDTIGIFGHYIEDLKIISKLLFSFDQKDFILQNNPELPTEKLNTKKKDKVLILNINPNIVNKQNYDFFKDNFLTKLVDKDFDITYLTLPDQITENLLFAYQIISFSEALSSHANLTGINFGFNLEKNKDLDFFNLIKSNRTLAFGKELKRRYVLGSFFTYGENQQRFYFKAMKFRNYLNKYFNDLFAKYDFVIHLSTADIAPFVKDIQQQKEKKILKPSLDDYLIISNFLGLPSINLPFAKKSNSFIGINVFAQFNHDYLLLNFAEKLTKIINFPENEITT